MRPAGQDVAAGAVERNAAGKDGAGKSHELLLFGQVPASRHEQVLSILAGIAAMQPQPLVEKHLMFKPARIPPVPRSGQTGAVQGVPNPQIQTIQAQTQGDVFYLQLVTEVETTTDPKEHGQGDENLGRGETGTAEDGVSSIGQ